MSEEQRKVVVLEDAGIGNGITLVKDEIRFLPAGLAQLCINAGWVRCAETGEVGERKTGNVLLTPDPSIQGMG